MDRIDQLGAGLDELEDYLNLADRISSEKDVEARRFVDSALNLMRLEGSRWSRISRKSSLN